jgi:hypothetical protein
MESIFSKAGPLPLLLHPPCDLSLLHSSFSSYPRFFRHRFISSTDHIPLRSWYVVMINVNMTHVLTFRREEVKRAELQVLMGLHKLR